MRIRPWIRMVGSRQFGLSSPYDCHVYALRSQAGILLIDAGSGLATSRIVANLREEFGDDLSCGGTILVTHKHPDHAAGAAALSRELGWPVWTSVHTRDVLVSGDAEASGLRDAQAAGGYPSTMACEACAVAGSFEDGEIVRLEGFELQAIRVQGHASDAFAFVCVHDGVRCLFTADIVFYGGVIGLIQSRDSNLQDYRRDIGKLTGLHIDALFPGHGLFTLEGGQQHIDAAAAELRKGFVPRCVGQGDLIF